jgi:cytochrome P450
MMATPYPVPSDRTLFLKYAELLLTCMQCSREDIYGHVVTFLAAGIETTSYGLAYAILLLARHPEVTFSNSARTSA